LNFKLYFAVRTLDSSQFADQYYTTRGAASWMVDGLGTVTAGVYKSINKNGGDPWFNIVQDGSRPNEVSGTTMNEVTWPGWQTIPITPP